jgi:hypothetical protein
MENDKPMNQNMVEVQNWDHSRTLDCPNWAPEEAVAEMPVVLDWPLGRDLRLPRAATRRLEILAS